MGRTEKEFIQRLSNKTKSIIMHFKLPSIHHLTNQNKKISNDNPSLYVHVMNGYAYVNHDLIAVVNLRQYVKSECDVENEQDLDELDDILQWFEGKSFTKEFWAQLTKEKMVTLSDDSLRIEDSSFTNFLHYTSVELDLRSSLKVVSDNININDFSLYRVSFSGKHLELLQKAFKNELSKDFLNFEFSETGKPVKFSLSVRNFIFGSIQSTMNSASELMAFLENKDFQSIVEEHLTSLPPLPPEDPEDMDSEQAFDAGDDAPIFQ